MRWSHHNLAFIASANVFLKRQCLSQMQLIKLITGTAWRCFVACALQKDRVGDPQVLWSSINGLPEGKIQSGPYLLRPYLSSARLCSPYIISNRESPCQKYISRRTQLVPHLIDEDTVLLSFRMWHIIIPDCAYWTTDASGLKTSPDIP